MKSWLPYHVHSSLPAFWLHGVDNPKTRSLRSAYRHSQNGCEDQLLDAPYSIRQLRDMVSGGLTSLGSEPNRRSRLHQVHFVDLADAVSCRLHSQGEMAKDSGYPQNVFIPETIQLLYN